jgi:hypothetical protein
MASESPSWDEFAAEINALPLAGGAAHPAQASNGLDLLCDEYERLSDLVERESERLKAIADKIADLVHIAPDAVNETATVTLPGGVTLEVSRGERYVWEQDIIEQIITTAPHAVVETKYSIPKKKFEALEPAEKAVFMPALTRKPGPLKITIKR